MDLIEEMETYALKEDIPIMQKEGIEFMCSFIREHQIKNILEIGSAIGYSAIRMALVDPTIHITTIERDEARYLSALDYIERSGIKEQIEILHGDALLTNITQSYDMIFIDAAKAQYIKFFEHYENNLKQNGFVISDNLKFHGYVEHSELATSRNLRQLVRKIKNFVTYLKDREDYETQFFEFGDGVGISRKK
ncbi:MAG: O-methyltransferase [Longicatena sp.]